MKIFIVALIFAICNGMPISDKCDKPVILLLEPICGILSNCYQNAPNKHVLNIYSCQRREKGLPDYLERKLGKCPTEKPSCPSIQ